MPEVINLATKRRPSVAEATASRAYDEIITQIATAPDGTAASFSAIYGAARFLAGRGIPAVLVAEVAQMLINHMVEIEAHERRRRHQEVEPALGQ